MYFKGTVATEAEKNEIWTAIKTIPTWKDDVVADIQVTGGPAASTAKATTYTVKAGDTLSQIAPVLRLFWRSWVMVWMPLLLKSQFLKV